MKFSGSFLHTSANDLKVSYKKGHGHCTLFVISNFVLPHSRSTIIRQILFWEGFLSLWNNMFFLDWHSLWPALTRRVCQVTTVFRTTGWHFAQQSCSSFQFLWGYWPKPAETLPRAFHCTWLSMFSPSSCDVKVMRCLHQGHTLTKPLPNCLCHILKHFWVMCNQCQHGSQPFAGGTPLYPADRVCRPTPNVAGESPSSTDKMMSMQSKMKKSQVSISPISCWMSFSPVRKCWTCVGWDGVLISSSAPSAFRSQQICNSLNEISCRCWFNPGWLSCMCHWLHEVNMLSNG